MKQEQDWRQLGHGRYVHRCIHVYVVVDELIYVYKTIRYLELNDTKEFFAAAKKSERMIVHFYRGVTPRCEIVDAHFEKLAAKVC